MRLEAAARRRHHERVTSPSLDFVLALVLTMSVAHPAPSHPTNDGAEASERELFHRLQNLDDMIRASEEVKDKYRSLSERRRIPPVPDLRFEYSYLRSVSQYVHLERPSPSGKGKGKEDEAADNEGGATGSEVVRVEWGHILWITTRDQLISPLLQGALWYVI